MELGADLIKQFVDATNDSKRSTKTNNTHNATAIVNGDGVFVKIDGSSAMTPVAMATDVRNGDRVLVTIENHRANIIGNITSPASGRGASDLYDETVKEDGTIESSGSLAPAKKFIDELTAKEITADSIIADSAKIEKLETDKLDAKSADLKYADINFSNIGQAAMEYFYAQSGLIKNVVVGDQTITGELVGVTIKGDLIEGNTIVADKLVVKGEDGLYYKLNTDGIKTEAEQTDYNSLNGQVIRAKSVTAEKISVTDLVAFGATIGGFHIGDSSLYSGVKDSVNNTTMGIFLGNDGQIAFGDASNYIKYYKDENGNYKLAISTESFAINLGEKNLNEVIEEVKSDIDNVRDEITTLLRIESSRGVVFKNNSISTVLSAVIYHGKSRITDIDALKSTFGNSAYLQWKWQHLDEETYGIISSSDSRIGNDGFTFTLSPDDVDTKVTFMCELIV